MRAVTPANPGHAPIEWGYYQKVFGWGHQHHERYRRVPVHGARNRGQRTSRRHGRLVLPTAEVSSNWQVYFGVKEDPGSDGTDGTGSRPMAFNFSNTLIGPWSRPERSNAARTWQACSLTSSLILDGLVRGRRDRGSNAGAGPSVRARPSNT